MVHKQFQSMWPKNRNGNDMCLPFHHRGTCYDNCSQKADHYAHNDAEEATFCTFLQDIFAKWHLN